MHEIVFESETTGEDVVFTINTGETLSDVESRIRDSPHVTDPPRTLADSDNPDWGMTFIARSAVTANETSIDASLAVVNSNGYRIGNDYSLPHNVAGIAKEEWATEEMTNWIESRIEAERERMATEESGE